VVAISIDSLGDIGSFGSAKIWTPLVSTTRASLVLYYIYILALGTTNKEQVSVELFFLKQA